MSHNGKKWLSTLSIRDMFPAGKTCSVPDENAFYETLAEQCKRLWQKMGTQGQGFRARQDELLHAAPDVYRMIGVMKTAAYILPLLDLWKGGHYGSNVPCTPELLEHLERLAVNSRRKRLGRLALRELCQCFFSRYDRLQALTLSALCRVLHRQFDRYQLQELLFGLDQFKVQKELFLQPKGHEELAHLTEKHMSILADEAKRHGIPLTGSRFFEASQQYYYLFRLRKLQPNEENALLEELQETRVYESRLSASRRLGHEALEILITTLDNASCSPSELWRTTLLSIAKDPRVPKTTPSYRDWWAQIDNKYADIMRRWLAEVDIELFLRILKEYAQRAGDSALQRMYPDREEFLQGIRKKKLIISTQLFLGTGAKYYIQRQCPKNTPYTVTIRGSDAKDLAVFYLNLGKAHLIEGTHNFKLKILERIPSNSPLERNWNMSSVDRRELGEGLKEQYLRAFGEEGYFEKVHHPSGTWKRAAIDCLRTLGIPLQERDVMSRETFMRSYK